MDYHFVALAIGSDITHTITKDYVTAPEIVLLRAIHGETAVSEIRPTGSFDHDSDAERNRLGELYNDEKVEEVFGKFGEVPATLADAKVEESYMDKMWLRDSKEAPKKQPKKQPKNVLGRRRERSLQTTQRLTRTRRGSQPRSK